MKKILASVLTFMLLLNLVTISAAANESNVTLSEKYGKLSIENVISQRTLQSDQGELVVYTVGAGGTLYQELQQGNCYRIERLLAVEENGAIRYTDAPNLGFDLDIFEPNQTEEPFYYIMEGANDPEFIHVFEVEVREHQTTRFALELDPNAVPKASRFQSTAKLTGATVADMDFDDFTLTVTNPTDSRDSGTVALVLASKRATVHFVDYDLAPKESKEYHVAVSGHIGMGVDQRMVVLGQGWSAYLNADIITFESDEDLNTYRNAVVYEENIDTYVTQGTRENAHVVICNGQPGDQWLKNYTGIGRHGKPLANSAVTHDICGK